MANKYQCIFLVGCIGGRSVIRFSVAGSIYSAQRASPGINLILVSSVKSAYFAIVG
jgi:hypothetical protein